MTASNRALAPNTDSPLGASPFTNNSNYVKRPATAVAGGSEQDDADSTPGLQSQGVLGNASTSSNSQACPSERPEGYVIGQPARESAESSATPADTVPGYALRPGEWQPKPAPPPKRPEGEKDKGHDKQGASCETSLAERRGFDWGLRDAARGSVGITRPIRVECYADRLVVVSENGPADNKVVPLGPRTLSSIDMFISAVWGRMESWGMAGRGMYWRPVLQVDVAPGAEGRFADLSALLQDSGITVRKK